MPANVLFDSPGPATVARHRIYTVLAVRRVYGGSTWSAILRSSALAATYFAAFTLAMLLTFAVAALRV